MTIAALMDPLLDFAPCSFVVFDDQRRIRVVNQTMAELLGYGRDELLRLPLDNVLTVANRIFYQTHIFPMLKLHGRVEEVQLSLQSSTGEEMPMLGSFSRKEDSGGVLNHCAMVPVRQLRKYEDEILRARRTAEDALRSNEEMVRIQQELEQYTLELDRKLAALGQKNQELAKVSQLLSHDLREPIRKIAWFAEVLTDESGSELSPKARSWVDKITVACRRADELLLVLREFVSLDAGDGGPEEVDLGAALEFARREVAPEGEGLELESEPLPVVTGMRRQLMLLFRNLLQFTLDMSGEQPARVVVSGSIVKQNGFRMIEGKYRYEDFARIVVQARGVQLPPVPGGQVFDPVVSLRHWTSGDGLGLATCRKIVENHHGHISLTTKTEAEALFVILLPLSG